MRTVRAGTTRAQPFGLFQKIDKRRRAKFIPYSKNADWKKAGIDSRKLTLFNL